jgi:hypothetical protein
MAAGTSDRWVDFTYGQSNKEASSENKGGDGKNIGIRWSGGGFDWSRDELRSVMQC